MEFYSIRCITVQPVSADKDIGQSYWIKPCGLFITSQDLPRPLALLIATHARGPGDEAVAKIQSAHNVWICACL